MSGVVVGSAYAVSAGLIIYGITAKIIPKEYQFPLIIAWAAIGIVLAFVGVLRKGRSDK